MKKNSKSIPTQVINEFKDLVYEGHNKAAESGDESDLLTLSDVRIFYSYGGDLFIFDPERPEIEEFSKEAQVSWEQGTRMYWADHVYQISKEKNL